MAHLAQGGAKGFDLVGETLGEVVTVEDATMVSMEVMEESKTATADDVISLSRQIAQLRMRKRKWRQI